MDGKCQSNVKQRPNVVAIANEDIDNEGGKPNGAAAAENASTVVADFTRELYSARSSSVVHPSVIAGNHAATLSKKGPTSFSCEETYGGAKEDILELLELLEHPSHSNLQRLRFALLLWRRSRG